MKASQNEEAATIIDNEEGSSNKKNKKYSLYTWG
jgi:hypothetical protein